MIKFLISSLLFWCAISFVLSLDDDLTTISATNDVEDSEEVTEITGNHTGAVQDDEYKLLTDMNSKQLHPFTRRTRKPVEIKPGSIRDRLNKLTRRPKTPRVTRRRKTKPTPGQNIDVGT